MSNPRDIRKDVARIQGTCIHFDGIQHRVCKAGVNYMSMRDVSQPGMACWPCLTTVNEKIATTVCEKREFPTAEQAQQQAEEHEARIQAFLAKLADGKNCPHCDAPIQTRKVIGRCEYVYPCGHRLGQVSVGEGEY